MKIVINSKNYNASEKLKETIEKKFAKLDKYFSNEITANVMTLREKGKYKVEATINTKGTIFRAEVLAEDPYEGVDRVVEKLSRQMSKFKTKLQRKYKDHKDFAFAELPETEEDQDDIQVVRKKRFDLVPMTVDEAVVQMELLEHNFFVFLNMETDSVGVVYKRNDNDYGLLETAY
ncbi:ribosome-associated translation inhibitor RaiA [Anaerovorax odorimutans]|uniref:Ribosome hibernation promoting factor n=1 Tax=Anaerovorax odorimutans TaxID=109327 RepID=A0ABT1RKR7_9FIRM|nr:ribosome-associated translation inhibitor RaiA [Anaerovorax odorimutans]MCQ4635776.1 ribosome-associated translation inhibitor RaiA [Anaerovorax odorimutans]